MTPLVVLVLSMSDSFFEEQNLPRLDEAEIANLDSALSIEEVQQAIRTMQSGICDGGFVTEFYKTFSNDLGRLLLAMYSK